MADLIASQSLATTDAGEFATTAAGEFATTAAGEFATTATGEFSTTATTADDELTIAHKHSLYDDMILSAIGALKAGKGSTWYAISKYISDNYSDLPPTHATILTDRLRELQAKGVIRMLKHCYKLEDGSRKRGRPLKSISSLKPKSISTREGKKRGRPRKLLPNVDATSKRKRGRPLKAVDPVANGPVYIVSQAEQLSSGVLKGFPGAVAIVLPKSLLTEEAARSPILIMPKGIQSLIDASASEKKLGRPKNVDIKRRRGRPRKKALLSKQGIGIHGDVNGKASNLVAKGPGRPWKIRDLLVPGNTDEMLQKSGEEVVLGSAQGAEATAGSEVVKRSVGRPRKKAIS